MTPEHKKKISDSVRAFHAAKNKGKYDRVKYPRLSESRNLSKKLKLEDIIRIQEMAKLGFAISEIAKELGFKYHTVRYHTIPEDERRVINQRGHLGAWARIKSDPDLHRKTLDRMTKSRRRRRHIHGAKWKLWDSKTSNKRYARKKQYPHPILFFTQ